MQGFPIVPPLVVKDTPKPRRLTTLFIALSFPTWLATTFWASVPPSSVGANKNASFVAPRRGRHRSFRSSHWSHSDA